MRRSVVEDVRPLGLVLAGLVLCARAGFAQEPAPTPAPPAAEAPAPSPTPSVPPPPTPVPIPALQERNLLPPAEVAYVHPLYRPLDTPARLQERPTPPDLERRTTLFVAVRVDDTGKVADAVAVEPPLRGLVPAIAPLLPRWRFTAARKGGGPVATWVTFGFDLQIELEKAVVSSFEVKPIGKDDPLPALVRESAGDTWMSRYPKAISPPEGGTVSIEEVDVLPSPEKAKWDFDSTRVRSRVTALLLIGASGQARRLAPIGGSAEPLLVAWLREMAAGWRFLPAVSKGSPVDSWVTLDITLEYTINSAKDKGKRVVKKNLRGEPG